MLCVCVCVCVRACVWVSTASIFVIIRIHEPQATYQLASLLRAAAEQFKSAEIRKAEAELRDIQGKGRIMRTKTLKQELKLFSALGTSTAAFDKAAEEASHLQAVGLAKEVQIGFDEGLQWMKRAAHMKHVKALYEIGMMYLEADSPLERDVDRGQEFVKLAAAKDHIRAPTTLAILYTKGERVDNEERDGPWLVEQNHKLALNYLKQGVRQKVPQAMHMLAESYCEGRAVKRNTTRCFKLMRKAAKRGGSAPTRSLISTHSSTLPRPPVLTLSQAMWLLSMTWRSCTMMARARKRTRIYFCSICGSLPSRSTRQPSTGSGCATTRRVNRTNTPC